MRRSILFAWLLVTLTAAAGLGRAAAAQTLADASQRGPRFLLASGSRVTPLVVAKVPVLSRRLALELEGVTLKQALAEISRRSGLRLVYTDDVLPKDQPVHLRAAAITVAAALTDLLLGADVDVVFRPDGGAALVRRAEVQSGSVVGRVTDSKTGQGLGGVDVSLDGTRWRTVTGEDGRYRLADITPGSYTVLARRIGYGPERRAVTVTAGQETAVDVVALQPAATRLGDVVVTARKREERLQDVPLSIAVVTAEEIDRRGLVSAEDYLRGIPGVNQTEPALFGQSIQIRGIETTTINQNQFSGPAVATYIGETPTTTSAGLAGGTNIDVKLVDIERVEVLRGPQGTAFGGSAMGGAVRTIPVAPKLDRVEGKLAAGYSATTGTGGDNYNFQAVGNFPLIRDKLALRATGYRYEQSGFYRNVAGSNPTLPVQTAVAQFGAPQAVAVDEEEVGGSRFTGGRIAALFQASDKLKVTLSYLTQKTERDGYSGVQLVPAGDVTGYEQSVLQNAPEYADGDRTGMRFDTDIDIANAVMAYDFGWANLLGTYSYVNGGGVTAIPQTAVLLPWPLTEFGTSDHRAHVGELRLATQLDGAWNFLAGLYAEELKDDLVRTYPWYGDPAANFFAPGTRSVGSNLQQRDLTQKAAFGEASWELLHGVTLTGGVRAYEYSRTRQRTGVGPLGGSHPDIANKASGANFRANLSYKPADGALLYGGWTEGFRLGAVQPGLNPAICDLDGDGLIDGTSRSLAATERLDSDQVDSYELGGKFALLDRRLTIDAAVFRMDWSDIPVAVNLVGVPGVSPTCGNVSTHQANAGTARSEGVEFQANLYVTEAFRVDVGGSWINARLTEDVPRLGAVAGDRLPGTPEFTANLGLQYAFGIAGQKPSVRADATYIGPNYASLRIGRGEGFVKVDASARVPVRGTNIDLVVRNLTNRDALIMFGSRLRPRTIGLQLSRDFTF